MLKRLSILTCAAALFGCNNAPEDDYAKAKLLAPNGESRGVVWLQQKDNGVQINAEIEGVPPGKHAIHIHETGSCAGDGFSSAGGHYNPTQTSHGTMDGAPAHLGDLDNFDMPDQGVATFERFIEGAALKNGEHNLLDQDGAAVIVHENPDDYQSQPAGAAGPRIACGVIEPSPNPPPSVP